VALALGLMLGIWQQRAGRRITEEVWIPSIMGTATTLKAVVPAGEAWRGRNALQAAEEALRGVEARMSDWVGTTEIGRWNEAPARTRMALSPGTVALLRQAIQLSRQTDGAFDVTCRPLVQLWRRAGERDREPSSDELREALGKVGWQGLSLDGLELEKLKEGVTIDLGAVAKGYAVDQAVAAMQREGAMGGLVQCGGDLRVFGEPEGGGLWRIEMEGPVREVGVQPRVLALGPGAVSTSGDSERSILIGGRRWHHIVDPRTGWPVAGVPRVTVLAPEAVVSDGWSTALTVLGAEGLGRLPAGVEAVVWVREGSGWKAVESVGFPQARKGDR
jgi:thiamine biosynthesis lipoprotein